MKLLRTCTCITFMLWLSPVGIILAQPIMVSLPDTSIDSGVVSVTIPIRVGDLTGLNVISHQSTVTFDDSILNCIGATSVGTITEPWGMPTTNCTVPGQISIGGFGTTPLSGSGALVGLIFDVVGNPGDTTALTFTSFIFNAGSPSADTINGRLVIRIPNHPPVLDSIPDMTLNEGDMLYIPVSAEDIDGDSITLTAKNLPLFGSLTDSGDGSGMITFTPGFDDAGVYPNIQMIATDDGTTPLSDTTTFTLTVADSNRAPIALDDSITTPEDTLVIICVLDNDTGPDNDSLTVTGVTQPSNGSAVIDNGDTTVTYTPNPNFFGADSFDYAVSDGIAADTARVHIIVSPVNDPPTILSNFPNPIEFPSDTTFFFHLDTVVTDTDDAVETLTWNVFETSKVSVSIDSNTHYCVISYLPTENIVSDTIYFTVTDTSLASDTINVVVNVDIVTGVAGFENLIPKEYGLNQNYPNPFNPTTNIRFGLPKASHVRIEIFNLLGERIQTLLNADKPAGYHIVTLNANNLASGIYLYRIQAGDFVKVKKMILLR